MVRGILEYIAGDLPEYPGVTSDHSLVECHLGLKGSNIFFMTRSLYVQPHTIMALSWLISYSGSYLVVLREVDITRWDGH